MKIVKEPTPEETKLFDIKQGQIAIITKCPYSYTGKIVQRSNNNLVELGGEFVWTEFFKKSGDDYNEFNKYFCRILPKGTVLEI